MPIVGSSDPLRAFGRRPLRVFRPPARRPSIPKPMSSATLASAGLRAPFSTPLSAPGPTALFAMLWRAFSAPTRTTAPTTNSATTSTMAPATAPLPVPGPARRRRLLLGG
jgi:hypothetical protein